ncbi:MarR family winged helix-turn-helix transcriptional regulator [Nonomuraea lactucae]|uniref:MarR family winged helix-turn-helix transcriptional regulator n=1 Tax=Nonomuraea lactucae TaxID=2249762 RepID=UPI0013B35959|nr:MarR family winged helix-turn-helix transcriptional regulator [Nonomuraea lactucae]
MVGITPAGVWIVARLDGKGWVRDETLARRARVSRARGRPYADQLIDRGLLERSPNGDHLRLTEEGQQAALRLLRSSHESLSRLVADWGPDPQLEQLCARITPQSLGARADRPG